MTPFVAQTLRAYDLLVADFRRHGLRVDPSVEAFRDALRANGGHPGASLDGLDGSADAGRMLVMSYDEAGRRLGRSASTIKRLVRAGELPSVLVGGQPGIRASDLETYVASLPTIEKGAA